MPIGLWEKTGQSLCLTGPYGPPCSDPVRSAFLRQPPDLTHTTVPPHTQHMETDGNLACSWSLCFSDMFSTSLLLYWSLPLPSLTYNYLLPIPSFYGTSFIHSYIHTHLTECCVSMTWNHVIFFQVDCELFGSQDGVLHTLIFFTGLTQGKYEVWMKSITVDAHYQAKYSSFLWLLLWGRHIRPFKG